VQFKRRKTARDLAAPQISLGLKRCVRHSDLDEGRDGDRAETRDGRARGRNSGGGEQRRGQPSGRASSRILSAAA
jgi:hypothetical protein